MSARRLAEVAGGSHANIIRIESGQQPKPGAEKIAGYAKVLGVSPEWLLTGEGSMHPVERTVEPIDVDELGPYEAARAWFLAEQRLEGRVEEAKAFLAVRRSYAGAEDKGPGWWLEHLKDEFRAWRKAGGR